MVKEILGASGVSYRRGRFTSPPPGTFAVFRDDVTADGADGINMIFEHDVTVELYEPRPDDDAETALEAALNAQGLPWEKQDRYWIQSEQRYQVVYEFSYIVKKQGGINLG